MSSWLLCGCRVFAQEMSQGHYRHKWPGVLSPNTVQSDIYRFCRSFRGQDFYPLKPPKLWKIIPTMHSSNLRVLIFPLQKSLQFLKVKVKVVHWFVYSKPVTRCQLLINAIVVLRNHFYIGLWTDRNWISVTTKGTNGSKTSKEDPTKFRPMTVVFILFFELNGYCLVGPTAALKTYTWKAQSPGGGRNRGTGRNDQRESNY